MVPLWDNASFSTSGADDLAVRVAQLHPHHSKSSSQLPAPGGWYHVLLSCVRKPQTSLCLWASPSQSALCANSALLLQRSQFKECSAGVDLNGQTAVLQRCVHWQQALPAFTVSQGQRDLLCSLTLTGGTAQAMAGHWCSASHWAVSSFAGTD